jgi:hypothetical protein
MSGNKLKEKNKENLKECKICNFTIDIDNEHHLILDEKRGQKLISKSYYHANCFRERFLVQQQMKQYLNQAQGMIGNLMGVNS